jgi:hypothetical protein
MFEVTFSIIHDGCLVNELSRRFPEVRFVCPGGFVLGASAVEELIILDAPSDSQVQSVMAHLEALDEIASVRLLERTGDGAFVYFRSTRVPRAFCSQVVERNRGFRIGFEIQQNGLEIWRVACVERAHAEQLLVDLADLGQITEHSIKEVSWQELLEFRSPEQPEPDAG